MEHVHPISLGKTGLCINDKHIKTKKVDPTKCNHLKYDQPSVKSCMVLAYARFSRLVSVEQKNFRTIPAPKSVETTPFS
jgi:hypothetical protein